MRNDRRAWGSMGVVVVALLFPACEQGVTGTIELFPHGAGNTNSGGEQNGGAGGAASGGTASGGMTPKGGASGATGGLTAGGVAGASGGRASGGAGANTGGKRPCSSDDDCTPPDKCELPIGHCELPDD